MSKRQVHSQFSEDEYDILRSLLSQKPVFMDIPLDQIHIDWSYQDRPREKLVAQIAAAFYPVMAGVPVLAQRPDGSLYCGDGVTRVTGMRRAGHERIVVHSQVVRVKDVGQEALLFKFLNCERKSVPPANRFQAAHVAGTDKGFGSLLEKTGFRLTGTGEHVIKGPSFLRQAFELDEGESLQKALYSLKATWGKRFDGTVVLGVAMLYNRTNEPIDDKLRKVLGRVGPAKLNEHVVKAWGGGEKLGSTLRACAKPAFITTVLAQLMNNATPKGKGKKLNIAALRDSLSELVVV